MKLHQTEYCHNCNQHVDFEFEDVIGKQVIICPNCGHEHYREIDGTTIANIRVHPQCREIRIAKPLPVLGFIENPDTILEIPREEVEVKKVYGTTEDGRAIIEGGEVKRVTERRWGQDPRQ